MIETITKVADARRRLQNTRGMGDQQVRDLKAIIDQFNALWPPKYKQCIGCRCMQFSEHVTKDGGSIWACSACHRSAALTQEEFHAEQARERAAADARLAAAAGPAPNPRQHVRDQLAGLTEAKNTVLKLEAALAPAKAGVALAQARHDAAVELAESANADAADAAAMACIGGKPPGPMPSAAAARAELAASVDSLMVAKNAKAILDTKLRDAQSAVSFANDKTKKAARGVIAAELQEELIADTIEAKAEYIEFVGRLRWLHVNHALVGDQSRRSTADRRYEYAGECVARRQHCRHRGDGSRTRFVVS